MKLLTRLLRELLANIYRLARVTMQKSPQPILSRGDYKTVWDNMARTYDDARLFVTGPMDLAAYRASGEADAQGFISGIPIVPTDCVLEIGCGTGRLGPKIAQHCAHWTGADVSSNMLRYARKTLQGRTNVSFHELNGRDLDGIPTGSMDVVYCAVVFMHLDEWDRYRYVTEMWRVLKPGGRAYYNNFNLLGEEGWAVFLDHCAIDPLLRPPAFSKSSTSEELRVYAERAGFTDIRTSASTKWIEVFAKKPTRTAAAGAA